MNALPVLRFGDLTIPAAKAINAAASAGRSVSAAAERSVIPLVYGEDRIKGLIVNVLPAGASSPTLLVQVLWCYAGDSVNDVRLNDKTIPAGATLTHYTGAQTTPDAALVTAFSAQSITYADTLAGLMYSVLAMPTSAFDGQLEISARIRGRRLYDVRKDSTAGGSGAHLIANPSTWEWSDNPALAQADFLRDVTYGLARAVDQSTVGAVANACDALIGSPAEKRRILGVSFTQAAGASDIAEALRAYAGCFLLQGPSGIKLIADLAGSSVATYNHADGAIASISDLQRSDIGNIPTAVEVSYTDTSQIPWREATAVATLAGAGTTRPWRLSQVRLPGIKRYSQAFREASERRDKLSGFDLSCVLEVFDIGVSHEEGDIITVTHPIGLSATTMRVASVAMPAPGKWRLGLMQHSAGAYSTATPASPTFSAPGLTNAVGPPSSVSSLAGAAGDGVITWSWAAITDRNYAETQLRLGGTDWATATPLWSGRGTGFVHQITSPGTYTVRARHMLDDGQLSTGTTSASATVSSVSGYVPDLTPPPAPLGLAAVSLFRGILIEWTSPTYTVGNGNDVTEVYVVTYAGGALPTIPATPVGVASGKTNYFVHDAAMGSQLHVWLRYRTRDNVQGPAAGGTNGLQLTVGRVGNSDLGDLIVTADKLAAASVTNAKMAANAIGLPNFAAGIEPVTIVTGSIVPTTKTTETIYLVGQSKIFRWNGTAYVATVPSTDISGQIADSQIAALAASKVTGQLSDAQIAAVGAAKLTGQITATQITDGAISTPKLAAGSVTTAVLAADAVTADKIAANAVTASEIAAGAITAGKIAAGAIVAGDIAAGAVTTAKLAANAVTANEIAANAITAGKVAAGAIGADQILANAIVAGKIAAGAIAVGSAAIADGAIRNALIENLAVDNAKIASLDAAKINAGFLAAARIQAGTIDVSKLNTNGLTVRDPSGNIILSSGVPLAQANAATSLRNDSIAVSGGVISGIGAGAGTQIDNTYQIIGQNLLPASDQNQSRMFANSAETTPSGLGLQVVNGAIIQGPDYAEVVYPGYQLLGGRSRLLYMSQSNRHTGTAVSEVDPLGNTLAGYSPFLHLIPVKPNDRMAIALDGNGHGCYWRVAALFITAAGAQIAWERGSFAAPASAITNVLAALQRSEAIFNVPATAATAQIWIWKYNSTVGNTSSVVFFGRPQLEVVAANAQGASPYSSGPASDATQLLSGGKISSSNASTYIADLAVNTLQIANNAVTVPLGSSLSAPVSATGSEITALSVGSIDTGGAPIFVIASVAVTGNANSLGNSPVVRLKVDGVTRATFTLTLGPSTSGSQQFVQNIYIASPGAGSKAVILTIDGSVGGSGAVSSQIGGGLSGTTVIAIGTKK